MKKPKTKTKKKVPPPRKMSSLDLCKALAGIAAFHVEDMAAQMKIYEAVRRLQIMERAAVEAGLLPPHT